MKKARITAIFFTALLFVISLATYNIFDRPHTTQEEPSIITAPPADTQKTTLIEERERKTSELINKEQEKYIAEQIPRPSRRKNGKVSYNDTRAVIPVSVFSFVAESKSFINPKRLISDPDGILLRVGGIDTGKGPVTLPAELQFDPSPVPSEAPIRYLVQFTGPVNQEWKEAITDLGGTIGDYIPNNTFIISLTSKQKETVSKLNFVQWIDFFHPAYKLSNDFGDEERLQLAIPSETNNSNTTSETGTDKPTPEDLDDETAAILLTVQTFDRGHLLYLQTLANKIPGTAIMKSSDTGKSRVILKVTTNDLDKVLVTLAQAPEVEWIEPFVPPELNNDTMAWVVQTDIPDNTNLWTNGLTGAGQIIGIGDTGLDVDMVFFWDSAQGLPTPTVNPDQRKIISYHDLAGNGDWDGHDHGTHVAGTVAGKSFGVNNDYNGVAYDAKLVIQDIGDGGSLTGIPADLNEYFQQAYNDGARIHSNSWGSAVAGAYTSFSQDVDEFMWNHKDFFIVFSAGNSGPAANTVGSPATAKNVLTSGASENAHTGYEQENVAYFSSNGPTDDGRIKPTVTAPGYYLFSADNDNDINTFNSGIRDMSGTSMSAPAHAGSAALVRQYYTDGYYPTGTNNPADTLTPSAALLKATMVNSAVNMTGTDIDAPIPGNGQGWGRVLLDNTLYFNGDSHSLSIKENTVGLQTAQTESFTFFSNGADPIKITLVWTDHYPALGSAIQLVNDLDLKVAGPSESFKGNVFSSGTSVTGGNHDRLNVVENVLIPHPEVGTYAITVSGYNIPNGPQPYALVVTGLTKGSNSASLTLNKPHYRSDAELIITLNDLDLNLSSELDTAIVQISASGDTDYPLTLTETTPDSGTFRGNFQLDTILQVTEGDAITVSYTDSDNGEGVSEVITATAIIDDTSPDITAVSIESIDENSATVTWQTSETATGTVYYRINEDSAWMEVKSTAASNHEVQLKELAATTLYEIIIEVSDIAGNTATADNDGEFYTFSTDIEKTIVSDDLEDQNSLFQLSGGSNNAGENGLWHISDYKASSGTYAWYYGLEATKTYDTGYHNWGHITSTNPIDLSNLDNAKLCFKHILTTENFELYDTARVEISEDNLIFTTVYQSILSALDWEKVSIDLTPYVGKTIYIRFSFDTEDEMFNDYQGWLIDDMRIITYHKKRGDIDGDGMITLADALLALRIATGNLVTTRFEIGADVNGDGLIGIPEAISALHSLSN